MLWNYIIYLLKKDANGVLSFEDTTGRTVALFTLAGVDSSAKFVGTVMSPDAEVNFEMEIPYGSPSYEGGEDLVNEVFADLPLSRGDRRGLWRSVLKIQPPSSKQFKIAPAPIGGAIFFFSSEIYKPLSYNFLFLYY